MALLYILTQISSNWLSKLVFQELENDNIIISNALKNSSFYEDILIEVSCY